jgi:RsiW-degrading membrane proteinase PrsW (M82 family)
MGKVLTMVIGLVLIVLGVLGCIKEPWQSAVVTFVLGGLVVMALLIGLMLFVLSVSDLRAGGEPKVVESTAGSEPPSQA